MKLQNLVISNNLKHKQDIIGVIEQMKPEITGSLGSQIFEELSKGFLKNADRVSDLLETKFSQLELNIQQKHDSVINAITNENNNRI